MTIVRVVFFVWGRVMMAGLLENRRRKTQGLLSRASGSRSEHVMRLALGVFEAAALVAQAAALADTFAQVIQLGSAGVASPDDFDLGNAR